MKTTEEIIKEIERRIELLKANPKHQFRSRKEIAHDQGVLQNLLFWIKANP